MLLPHLTCSFLQASGCWEFTSSLPALGDMELGAGGWVMRKAGSSKVGENRGNRVSALHPCLFQVLTQDLEVCPNTHTPPSWKLLRFQV